MSRNNKRSTERANLEKSTRKKKKPRTSKTLANILTQAATYYYNGEYLVAAQTYNKVLTEAYSELGSAIISMHYKRGEENSLGDLYFETAETTRLGISEKLDLGEAYETESLLKNLEQAQSYFSKAKECYSIQEDMDSCDLGIIQIDVLMAQVHCRTAVNDPLKQSSVAQLHIFLTSLNLKLVTLSKHYKFKSIEASRQHWELPKHADQDVLKTLYSAAAAVLTLCGRISFSNSKIPDGDQLQESVEQYQIDAGFLIESFEENYRAVLLPPSIFSHTPHERQYFSLEGDSAKGFYLTEMEEEECNTAAPCTV